jgi:hypothetical protein
LRKTLIPLILSLSVLIGCGLRPSNRLVGTWAAMADGSAKMTWSYTNDGKVRSNMNGDVTCCADYQISDDAKTLVLTVGSNSKDAKVIQYLLTWINDKTFTIQAPQDYGQPETIVWHRLN